MQNGHRWVVREKTTGKWIQKVTEASKDGIAFTDDLAEALRYGTRFRAEDDASYLTHYARMKKSTIPGMLFEAYEFDDSDRSRQVLPYLVFTPEERPERRKRKP